MTLKELHTIFLRSAGVCTDSRKLLSKQIFFALRGENFDGNKYVKQALSSDCILAVSDDPVWKNVERVFVVDSVLEVLQALANYHRKQKDVIVLAITGSNGKTTTKELIAKVLLSEFSTLYTEGNLNNHIGLPLTLLRLKDEKIAVLEMGANHPGEIALLCNIAEPDLGIITNIGKAHLEGFGSLEGVRKAKGELFDYLAKEDKHAFINVDDRILRDMAEERGLSTVEYGIEHAASVQGSLSATRPFLEGIVKLDNKEFSMSTSITGLYNFTNILAAISVAVHFEIAPKKIIRLLSEYVPDNNRSQLVEGKSNTLLLDAYNANPTSMKASLNDFNSDNVQKKMVILGEMLELGKESDAEHRSILEWLSKSNIDKILLIGELFSGLSDSGEYPFLFFTDIQECMDYLNEHKPTGYRILLKGSRKNALEHATNLLLSC